MGDEKPILGFKDPHVFPYLVKGFKEPGNLKFESRRNQIEAQQSADRFLAEGYSAWIFEVKEVKEQHP